MWEPIFGRLRHVPLPSSTQLDAVPTVWLLGLGALPAAVLGWLASENAIAAALLASAVGVGAWWQGRRVRVIWERGAPVDVEVVPPRPRWARSQGRVQAEEQPQAVSPTPAPPYPLHDPFVELMMLPGGSFWMGSDRALDPQIRDDELPRRWVGIRPFAISQTLVTRGLYRKVMRTAPERWANDPDEDLPANGVSWEDAVRFCNALSEQSGRAPCYSRSPAGWECDWDASGYRLPTEAEWEYACRAGTETPWLWGAEAEAADSHAWYRGNSGGRPHPVRKKRPNAWGLYDMAGNLREWRWDRYADAYDPNDLDNPRGPLNGWRRVLRGGSFAREARHLRSAVRFWLDPGHRAVRIGLRCVRGSGRQLEP